MPSGPVFNIQKVYGGVANTSGDNSPAQSGASHAAHIGDRLGIDPAALLPIFQALQQEIGRVTDIHRREALNDHIELAQIEAGKPANADPGRIKRALDAIGRGAEGLENGGTIIGLCNKAYNALAPLFGLPSSPLP